MKTPRGRGAIIRKRDILHFPATIFRHLVQQESVDRATNAETKDARVWVLLHFGNDFHLVSDIAISHEADDAHVVLRIGSIE